MACSGWGGRAQDARRKAQGSGQGRPLRNCPVGNFREEPDCRGGGTRAEGGGYFYINLIY